MKGSQAGRRAGGLGTGAAAGMGAGAGAATSGHVHAVRAWRGQSRLTGQWLQCKVPSTIKPLIYYLIVLSTSTSDLRHVNYDASRAFDVGLASP
jgi:hypothetical protein